MRLTRFPRLLSAALAGVAVGGVVAAGWNITAPDEPANTANEATERAAVSGVAPGDEDSANGADDGADAGDDAAAGAAQDAAGGAADEEPGPEAGEEPARPVLDLEPLDQPDDPFPDPDLPGRPGEESAELTRIEYELKRLTWIGVGHADEDTEISCSEDESTLSEPGDYQFHCDVSIDGVNVRFDIVATVTQTEVQWKWSAGYFAVSEKKAVHEATRQSFKPARVTCNFVGITKVRIGAKDGFRCWVTRPDGDQMTYHAEMLRDGSLVFRPGREP